MLFTQTRPDLNATQPISAFTNVEPPASTFASASFVSGPGSPAQSNCAAMPVANKLDPIGGGVPDMADVVPPRRRLQPALDEAVYLPVIQFADDVSRRGLKDFELCRLRRSPQYEAAQHLAPPFPPVAEVATFPRVICHDQVSVAPSLSSSFLPSCLSSLLPSCSHSDVAWHRVVQ